MGRALGVFFVADLTGCSPCEMHGGWSCTVQSFPQEQSPQTLGTPGHLTSSWHSPGDMPQATPLPSPAGWGQTSSPVLTRASPRAGELGGPPTPGAPNIHQLSATPTKRDGNATVSLPQNPGPAETLPILLVKLQHHVVCGHTEGPPCLVVLPPVGVVHVRGGHGAVVGVVVDVHGAAVVPRHIELNVWGVQEERRRGDVGLWVLSEGWDVGIVTAGILRGCGSGWLGSLL